MLIAAYPLVFNWCFVSVVQAQIGMEGSKSRDKGENQSHSTHIICVSGGICVYLGFNLSAVHKIVWGQLSLSWRNEICLTRLTTKVNLPECKLFVFWLFYLACEQAGIVHFTVPKINQSNVILILGSPAHTVGSSLLHILKQEYQLQLSPAFLLCYPIGLYLSLSLCCFMVCLWSSAVSRTIGKFCLSRKWTVWLSVNWLDSYSA